MMREQGDCTPPAFASANPLGEFVQVYVDHQHPLLQLKRALPWESISEVMVSAWRKAGKNVAGSRGRPWPVALYVPVLVLMLIRRLDSREMEAYLVENAVARVFIGRQQQLAPHIRDHANLARALSALGDEGVQEVNRLIIQQATRLGFADPRVVSADTTVQELSIGYPHEAGILKGVAQRCTRALLRIKKQAAVSVDAALDQAKEVLKTVKHYHLFAKGKEEKDQVLRQIMHKSEVLIKESERVAAQLGESSKEVVKAAVAKLKDMTEVAGTLLPQIEYWLTTGYVAAGKILHAGLPQAKAIVRNKAGKKVEFGLPYLINRLGGGYVYGKLLNKVQGENKMPLESLADYRQIFGAQATPELVVYDRGGHSQSTIKKLKKAGVKRIGIVPKGQAEWCVAEEDQKRVASERSRTEGVIGTLKSESYKFNKPKERLWHTVQAAGQQSILSLNLNKLMRDIVSKEKDAAPVQAQAAG
jgi:hypothetical protein